MKKLIAAAAAILLTAGIAGLTACSGSAEASVASTKSGSELTAAGIKPVSYTHLDELRFYFLNNSPALRKALLKWCYQHHSF